MKLPSLTRRALPAFRCKDVNGRSISISAGTVEVSAVSYPIVGLAKGRAQKSQSGVQRAVGAASGAAIGMLFSPIGAAIGAGVGATFAGTTKLRLSILTGLTGPIVDIEVSPGDLASIELAAGRSAY